MSLEEFLPIITNASPAALMAMVIFFYHRISSKRIEDIKTEYKQAWALENAMYEKRIAELRLDHAALINELRAQRESKSG